MRVLIVSNLYPPHYLGGYELRCAYVAGSLRRRGHDVIVLTSTYGLPASRFKRTQVHVEQFDDVIVHRALGQYAYGVQLALPPWTVTQARAELADARIFLELLADYQPDVINWWSMNGLTKTLLPVPSAHGIPDVHWIEDPWMIREYGSDGEIAAAFWRTLWDGTWGPHVVRPVLRRLGARWEQHTIRAGIFSRDLPNRPRHVCFVSKALEQHYLDAGFHFRSSEVVRGGVPVEPFLTASRLADASGGPLRVLYAGQLSRDRGVHTAIEAIAGLDSTARANLSLTIVGEGNPTYTAEVRSQVAALGLEDRVTFRGKVAHDEMPAIYRAHDVLAFTSTRPEGLPFTMVEAMLSGCAVLTTGSGGAMDIATAASLPLFPKEDARALGSLLARLSKNRAELRTIAERGQRVAQREFSADLMIDRLDHTLQRVAKSPISGNQ